MQRLITKQLLEWKNDDNFKPIIVRGARQVGKSFTISEFGKIYFKGRVHVVNFEKQRDWHKIFDRNLDTTRIVSELELLLGSTIEPGVDLLFFDEIQECPNAIMSLRYFYEQLPKLHIIAAGSLLEFSLQDISFPVGRVQLLDMYPMNFYEFLLATGKENVAKLISGSISLQSEIIDSMIKDELRKYFYVGGMPECVKIYSGTNSFIKVYDAQTNLIETFRQDFSKYAARSDKRCLTSVLASVSSRVGNQIKYTGLAEDFSNPTIKKSFELLETARLFKKVRSVTNPQVPLLSHSSDKKFKAIMLDIGLLSNLSGLSKSTDFFKSDTSGQFRGSLAEQFVGQEILSSGFNNLFYWARDTKNSNAEIDYLIQKSNKPIPIEVKSGPTGKLKSLNIFMQNYPEIEKAYVFSEATYGENVELRINFIPIYFTYSAITKDSI